MTVSATSGDVRISCAASAGFQDWLAQIGGALAVSTYQAGKVAMIGHDGQQVSLLMRHFDKPLGLAVSGSLMALATRHEVTLFANAGVLAHGYLENEPGRYDALFLPRVSYFTGDLNTHDIALLGHEPLVVNTRFSCLARLSPLHNFVPVWKPSFVSDIVPEDRCHLNGVAIRDGNPKYVTALGTTDVPGGWRANKAAGGVLLDVESGETILGGLSMPHSPRWYADQLWLLNSGTGELVIVNPPTGKSEVVARLPGYLRGLCFVGPYAIVGLCKIRERHIFGGLPIQQRSPRLLCGVAVIDLRGGTEVGMLEFTSGCEELYDVQFLPGVRRPMILNLEREAVRQAITHPQSAWWVRPSAEIKDAGAVPQSVSEFQSSAAEPKGDDAV